MSIPEKDKAEEYLLRIGYYRLSAYWHPMRKRDPGTSVVLDDFVDGTTFKETTDLYTFDGRLRLIMLDALERLEVALRTSVSLALGKHDPKAHRLAKYLDGKFVNSTPRGKVSKHREWINRLDRRFNQSKDQFAEHFRAKYPSDDMPIWIAVELLDFGPLSHLISGMKFKDKQEIGEKFGGLPPNLLASWTHSLSFTRNVCAHHSRLWNKPLVNQPSLTGISSTFLSELEHVRTNPGSDTRLYAIACIIKHLLSCANPRTKWAERFKSHIATFPESPRLHLSSAGFPEGWLETDLWNT